MSQPPCGPEPAPAAEAKGAAPSDSLPPFSMRDLLDAIERELPRSRPRRRALSLLLLELDHLQESNEHLDRAAINRIMQRAAGLVREHAREIDVVVRYGDHGLAVIVPNLDPPTVEHFAKTLREAIEHHRFEPGDLRITASLGQAEHTLPIDGADVLFYDARARLRRAIRLGGNRVNAWDEDWCVIIPRWPHRPRQPGPSLYFVVLQGTEIGRRYELAKGRTLTIGRSASNDICVHDDSVSRTHAIITANAHGVRICDSGSKNGIQVNGVELSECVLEFGDAIHIGHTTFTLGLLDPDTTNLEASSPLATQLPLVASSDDETEAVTVAAAKSSLEA